MKIFDEYIKQAAELILPLIDSDRGLMDVPYEGPLWPIEEKTPFIMERDTAAELGGYPKESVNLILSTSSKIPFEGVKILGRPEDIDAVREGKGAHLSFGKIVMLKVSGVEDDDIYDYQQNVQMADIRLRLRDVMLRTSSQQFFTNLRIGRKAAAAGFDLPIMGRTVREHFLSVNHVEEAAVILIVGDSDLYKELLPAAENVKKITVALNTMFEGIDMDCGSCSMSPICDEVDELRKLHKNIKK